MNYFVSYTTKDKEVTEELLIKFAWKFRNKGSIFIDLINNDSKDKQERIFNEIDKSDIFLLIETKSVYKSKWVKMELDRAKSCNIIIQKIKLIDIYNYIYYNKNLFN